MGRSQTKHRETFFAWNGPGPYICHFCGEDVFFEEVHVHHRDHDDYNNDKSNLVAAHVGCHHSYHRKQMTQEEKNAAAARMRNRTVSDETRQKMSEAKKARGKTGPEPEEVRQKKKEAVLKSWENPERKTPERGPDGRFIVSRA